MPRRPGSEIGKLSAIQSAGAAVAPLHHPIRAPRKGDWLYEYDEPGQTFNEYRGIDPVLPTCDRTTLYVQPLGDFEPTIADSIEATADMLGRFYSVPVRVLDRMDSTTVPNWARRQNPVSGDGQILTRIVLNLLARNKPADAVAVLALTASDLWPGKGGTSSSERRRFARASACGRSIAWATRNSNPGPSSAGRSRSRCTRPVTCSASGTAPASTAA